LCCGYLISLESFGECLVRYLVEIQACHVSSLTLAHELVDSLRISVSRVYLDKNRFISLVASHRCLSGLSPSALSSLLLIPLGTRSACTSPVQLVSVATCRARAYGSQSPKPWCAAGFEAVELCCRV